MTSSVRRSPVSVFESSSYSSVENSNFELPLIPAKRPRSKHRRLSSFNKLFLIQFIPPFQKHQSKTQCAGKPRKRISRSGESKESQLIVKSVGQILNPIWSKRNRNIPSETKEDNMNLQGNVCSDDHRLAIFKEIKMHSHYRFGTSQQEESENFDLTKKVV
ncbi:uncharacterized protein LOC127131653 [Lathyrus oleraceus]|uniref:uncharacterized protein LOC127131653 n=1 Tax=Pisum sativum TaxID=3888 RepID=UPI0021CFCD95|nr:uncharacterized protein LOC127131653 [Pisum sativum]